MLIERFESVPLPDVGVTELGVSVTVPVPDGRGVSTLRLTAEPNAGPVRLRLSVKETVSPALTAVWTLDDEVSVKSRLTVPTWTGKGTFLTVRYGLPACPWIHKV